MAQWLRALVTLAKDLGSIPTTHTGSSQAAVTPAPGDLMPCLASLGATHMRCPYSQAGTHTYK